MLGNSNGPGHHPFRRSGGLAPELACSERFLNFSGTMRILMTHVGSECPHVDAKKKIHSRLRRCSVVSNGIPNEKSFEDQGIKPDQISSSVLFRSIAPCRHKRHWSATTGSLSCNFVGDVGNQAQSPETNAPFWKQVSAGLCVFGMAVGSLGFVYWFYYQFLLSLASSY